MKLQALIDQILAEDMRLGQMPVNAYRSYWTAYIPIIKFFREMETEDYSPELIQEYIRWVTKRYQDGEIKRQRYSALTAAARRIAHFERTGTYLFAVPKRGSRYELDFYYTELMNAFLTSEDFHPNTLGDLKWTTRRYFHWLLMQGITDIREANQEIIQKYLHSCIEEMKPGSVYNVRLYQRKLYRFLYEKGYTEDSYEAFFAFKICRESRLLPAAGDEMVNAILNVIDTQTTIGKRDYAIILLGYVLGMRAADIAKLRLSEIFWAKGEIRFVQKKTDRAVTLPLTADVGEALRDYILNGRSQTDCEQIFLRANSPFLPFKDPFCINDRFRVYCKRAGIPREAWDGLGFHSLRRAAGKRLITSGTPVNTVAEVMGQATINSTKKYIALDSKGKRMYNSDIEICYSPDEVNRRRETGYVESI